MKFWSSRCVYGTLSGDHARAHARSKGSKISFPPLLSAEKGRQTSLKSWPAQTPREKSQTPPLKTSSRSVVTMTGGPPFQPRGATTVTRPRGLKGTLRPAKAVVRGVRYSVVSMPYIAFNARQWQHNVLVTDTSVMFWRTV